MLNAPGLGGSLKRIQVRKVLRFAVGSAGTRCLTRSSLDGRHVEKGSHGPRRMGCHGSIGNGARCVRTASAKPSATTAYGRYQTAAGRRLSARNGQPAPGSGKMQVVSGR